MLLHFMIDFENTRSKGLQGAEYLLPEDFVTIFYSQACLKIEHGRFQQIEESGCGLDIYKLQNKGKNALDFYIASRIGELYGQGCEDVTAIVSNDEGFKAIRDYWRSCSASHKNIILRGNIEQCIYSSNENSERRRQIQQKIQEINLEAEYGKYMERQKFRRALEDSFADTEYEGMLEKIITVTERKQSRKLLYLDTLRQFGKKDGLSIYHKVKQIQEKK